MAHEKYYANLNPFPVTLPAPRGSRRTVAPNEVIRGDWWSRLCGNRQLSEINPETYNIIGNKIVEGPSIVRKSRSRPPVNEIDFIPTPVRIKKSNRPRQQKLSKVDTLADDVCSSGCENSCEGPCELNAQSIKDLGDMRLVAGMYFCSYCDYNSSKQKDVERHLTREHNKEQLSDLEIDKAVEQEKKIAKKEAEVVNRVAVQNMPADKIPDESEELTEDQIEELEEDSFDDVRDFEEEGSEDEHDLKVIKEREDEETVDLAKVLEETEDYKVLEDGTHVCKECDKVCKSKAGLVRHINSKHRAGE